MSSAFLVGLWVTWATLALVQPEAGWTGSFGLWALVPLAVSHSNCLCPRFLHVKQMGSPSGVHSNRPCLCFPPLCRYDPGLNVSLPRRKRPSWSLNAAVLLLICIQNVGALVSHKRHKSDDHLGSTGKGPWLVPYFRLEASGFLGPAGAGSSGWALQWQ